MSLKRYQYTATVNGRLRSVRFLADAIEWGHYPDRAGEAFLNLATAYLLIHNERSVYEAFYEGAQQADYDAEHLSPLLLVEVPSWVTVESRED